MRLDSSLEAPRTPRGWRAERVNLVRLMAQPTDPLYSQLWHFKNTMSEAAWDSFTGVTTPVIAVLDTGLPSHPDLAGRIIGSQNFITSESVTDFNGHSTFCSGIIGAVPNNGLGIAGQHWDARILIIKVLAAGGFGEDVGVAEGMVAAVDAGAKVLSMSLGSDINGAIFQAAVDYARAAGVLVVASSGNGGTNFPYYPGATSGVLSVGATTRYDERTTYSTYNSNLQVMAPGGSGLLAEENILSTGLGTGFASGAGTSYSAPQVASAAALYWGFTPSATADQVFAAITSTADPIAKTSGWDLQTGWGRLNVARLLGQTSAPSVFLPSSLPTFLAGEGVTVTVSVGAGKPLASPLNQDLAAIDQVWAEFQDLSGTVLQSAQMPNTGPRTFGGPLYLPPWGGTGFRTVQLVFKASDTAGNTGVARRLPRATQYPVGGGPAPTPTPGGGPTPVPGVDSDPPFLAHAAPSYFTPGLPLDLYAQAIDARDPNPVVQYHSRPQGGSTWIPEAIPSNPPGLYRKALSSADLALPIEYFWTATDAAGNQARVPASGYFTLFALSPSYPLAGVLPYLAHNPPGAAIKGKPLVIQATANGGTSPLFSVTLTYLHTQLGWFSTAMTQESSTSWSASIPASQVQKGTISYYVQATDTQLRQSQLKGPGDPYKVPVQEQPFALTASENPSKGALCAILRVSQSSSQTAQIRFYSLAGELVDSLEAGLGQAQQRHCAGRTVPPGIYFAVLSAPNQPPQVLKLAVVR